MNKKLTATLAIAALALAAATTAKADPVKIQFMHQQIEQDRQEVVQAIIDEFQAEYPDIEVEQIPVNEDDYDQKITTLGGSGVLPAVVEYSQDQAKTSVANMFTSVSAVQDVIDAVGVENIYDGALAVTRTEDGEGFVGVPLCGWVQGIWVNTGMLKEKGFEVPTSWEEVLAVAEAFYDPDNKMYGIALPTSESAFTEQVFSQFALSNGANVFDGEKNVTVNTPEMKEAVEYYKALSAYSMPGSTEVIDVRDAFVGQSAPMCMYSTYILNRCVEAGFAEDLALALPSNKEAVAYGCITVLGIAEGMSEEETEAAKTFVSFLMEPAHNIEWLNMAPGGVQPVLKAVSDDPAFTDLEARKALAGLNDDIAAAVENLQLFGTVDGKNFTEMGDITNTGILSKMMNNVIVQGADVDAELAAAQSAVEALIQ